MDARVLFFFILLGTRGSCNARVVTTYRSQDATASVLKIIEQQLEIEDEGLCTFCQVTLFPVFKYLSNTTNEREMMAILHLLCALTFVMKDECNAIVDFYVPKIFIYASSMTTPKELCTTIGACECTNSSQPLSENICESCNHAFTDASLKLNHPDFQLHIVELLLKACNALEDYLKNHCKKLVLGKALLIPVDAKQMLDGHAICNLLYDCSSPTNAASNSETYLDSAF